jgi:hypothetical protein
MKNDDGCPAAFCSLMCLTKTTDYEAVERRNGWDGTRIATCGARRKSVLQLPVSDLRHLVAH